MSYRSGNGGKNRVRVLVASTKAKKSRGNYDLLDQCNLDVRVFTWDFI